VDTTDYLLSNPTNRDRLLKAVKNINTEKKLTEVNLANLKLLTDRQKGVVGIISLVVFSPPTFFYTQSILTAGFSQKNRQFAVGGVFTANLFLSKH